MKRSSLGKSTRFEVFKRDSFTCQYCARKSPDVVLEVDHIEPIAKGGTNDLLNLITACKDCNAGKSDRRLSESTILDKQRAQLEELQERREQIDMMFQWQKALLNLQDEVVDRLRQVWSEHVPGYTLNESGLRGLKKLTKAYSVGEIMAAIRIAADHYLVFQDGTITHDSVEYAWKKLGGICRITRIERDNPEIKRLYYIRGILRNRLSYCNEQQAITLLRRANELNAGLNSLEEFARAANNWTAWRAGMDQFITEHDSGGIDERKHAADAQNNGRGD